MARIQRPDRATETSQADSYAAALLAVAIANTVGAQQQAQLVVDHARRITGADSSRLFMWDSGTGTLRFLAGNSSAGVNRVAEHQPGVGASGQAFSSRQPVLIEDYDNWEGKRPGGLGTFASMAAVPLLVAERAVGVLNVSSVRQRAFNRQQLRVVSLFAAQIAPVLEGARLLAEADWHRTQVEALAAQLLEQSHELARSNAELQQFASVASHDLQEPLRVVASSAQALLHAASERPDSQLLKFAMAAAEGANRMRRIIDDLLKFSSAGGSSARRELTDCGSAVEQACQQLLVSIDESGALISHGQLPIVNADEIELTQVFQNLLGNAIKFRGNAQPVIRIEAQLESGFWTFSVRDNGIGLDPDAGDRIFELFQRGHANAGLPGTGIGLALCKKIVERHGGRIWVESQPGQGSTFFFTLPETTYQAGPVQSGPETPRPQATKDVCRVLIADDYAAAVDLLAWTVKSAGEIEVHTAQDGEEAVAKALELQPDLVLVDGIMPRLDGFGVTRQLRANARTRDVPIIVVTGIEGQEYMAEGFAVGVSDFIHKPFQVNEVRDKLTTWLRGRVP